VLWLEGHLEEMCVEKIRTNRKDTWQTAILQSTSTIQLRPESGNLVFMSIIDGRPRKFAPEQGWRRCYRRGAVWGYLEAPFSGPGADLRAAIFRGFSMFFAQVLCG
jgi:hypothetical protein